MLEATTNSYHMGNCVFKKKLNTSESMGTAGQLGLAWTSASSSITSLEYYSIF